MTKCKTCEYELVETGLLPCCICSEISTGNRSYWKLKEVKK